MPRSGGFRVGDRGRSQVGPRPRRHRRSSSAPACSSAAPSPRQPACSISVSLSSAVRSRSGSGRGSSPRHSVRSMLEPASPMPAAAVCNQSGSEPPARSWERPPSDGGASGDSWRFRRAACDRPGTERARRLIPRACMVDRGRSRGQSSPVTVAHRRSRVSGAGAARVVAPLASSASSGAGLAGVPDGDRLRRPRRTPLARGCRRMARLVQGVAPPCCFAVVASRMMSRPGRQEG